MDICRCGLKPHVLRKADLCGLKPHLRYQAPEIRLNQISFLKHESLTLIKRELTTALLQPSLGDF